MNRTTSLIILGVSLALTSSLSSAENIPEEDYEQMCKACDNCCSSIDNTEVIASTDIDEEDNKKATTKKRKVKKTSRKSKSRKKRSTTKNRKVRKARKHSHKSKPRKKRSTPKNTIRAHRKATTKPQAKIHTPSKPVSKASSWQSSSLYGSTMSVAALTPVKGYIQNNQFRVSIKSVFSIDCALSFTSRGLPSKLTNCSPYDSASSKKSAWRIKQKSISLDCSNSVSSTRCTGSYTVAFSEDDDRNETHKVTLSKRN